MAEDIGDSRRGCQLFEKALPTTERAFGEEDPQFITLLQNYGNHLGRSGEPVRAKQLFERALAICERAEMTTFLLITHCIYCGTLVRMGDLAEALIQAERAHALAAEHLEPENWEWVRTRLSLAYVYQHLGRNSEAREHYEWMIPILRGTKTASWWLGELLPTYGDLLVTMNDFEAAGEAYELALHYQQELLGEKHSSAALALSGMATLSARSGDLTRARELNEQALAIRRDVFGVAHPKVAESLAALAAVEALAGDSERAATLARSGGHLS
jgi:tetratricopeptide (TPR) repeat protein